MAFVVCLGHNVPMLSYTLNACIVIGNEKNILFSFSAHPLPHVAYCSILVSLYFNPVSPGL